MGKWLLALAVLVSACGNVATPLQSPNASPSAVAAASAPTTWTCSSAGASSSKVATAQPDTLFIQDLGTTTATGHDTVTIAFANGVPDLRNQLVMQDNATFMLSPKGEPVTLQGDHGILITLHGADMHTSFAGSRDSVTGYPAVAEVRVVQDFEGVVQIALGINGARCWAASMSSDPYRLTVEVRSVP